MKGRFKSVAKKLLLYFYLNHDNSFFFSKWNILRKKHFILKKEKKNLNFFNYHYNNSLACGPLQKDEAVFLFGLISCIQPRCVLELGFHKGHSAMAILNALVVNSEFTTIDIDSNCRKIFDNSFAGRFKNAKMIISDMSKIDYSKLFHSGTIDLVFFDAIHDLDINLKTYYNLKPYLSDDCIILVHDTGLWYKAHMGDIHHSIIARIKSKSMDSDSFAHQIDERRFVNYLIQKESFNAFHIHSRNTLRHGLTCLHKQNFLLST